MNNLPSFNEFLNEYQTYAEYRKGSWGTPQDLKDDVLISVKHLIPVDWKESEKYLKSTVDQSDDKQGIKFEIQLKTGDTIHAYKVGSYRGSWEWYLNKKKSSKQDILNYLEDKIYTPYQKWQRHYDMSDKTYMYADDNRAYASGRNHAEYIDKLYKALSSADKKKADEYKKK